ncbi:hypothetical protein [Curtobacterium sp. ISL-83]|uniref:hypothetical protein n=1 Tax=Curtobacterium sp. ISL-83 TaxID=2819145 RepID=UPI001BE601C7|nr:hypothetical protein [Curtobacterium sp. ISL-83]MBT2501411.1 hypothetical protein [Curtobacterium sp. ISL-83]
MYNGWRNALLAIWICLAVAAAALAAIGIIIASRAHGDVAMLTGSSALLAGAGICASRVFFFLLLWIVISAIVLEHEKTRRVLRGLSSGRD